ncbi:flagellar basal body L-ring protein FlgH [Extensimonas sp. H3M7-6]|uniref:flagellar basal body L-ring protein FlgH n=1 Tax=Extensimonas soli TaxID=3031322 RepID=UPI0023DC805F|nr:flagellar basal body L-ring protein FlgH [Extensimonas sp. H3M7-6]MDF1482789.1 flagellar basal body L-ring protein FlgH [Extensimonas sp. H3M7-6]
MARLFISVPALLRLLACAGAAALVGCTSLMEPPPVDVLPTKPQLPPAAAARPVNGSLFSTATYRPAFEDRRARFVGDTVTIMIVENVSAKQESSSGIDRSGSISGGIKSFPFVSNWLANKSTMDVGAENKFNGQGNTQSTNTFTGSITATVVEVLPNGHLVVTGEKQIGVNHNVDVLRFSGTVDPRNLLAGSVVNSTQVANVRIESRGRGAQAEAQAMGWLGRFFNMVTPF